MTDGAGAGTAVNGWKQPEHRQCVHLHGSGERCRRTAKTGEKFCHTHQRYADADPMFPVKVPLLEDPDSIRFVMSQTVRAMAMGTLPAANARSMLYGCRMALDLLNYKFAREKFESRAQSAGLRAQETSNSVRGAEDKAEGTGDRLQEIVPGPVALAKAEPAVVEECAAGLEALESEDCGQPVEEESDDAVTFQTRPITPRFPDLREQWETARARGEREVGRNLYGNDVEQWQRGERRQGGGVEAGHPQARAVSTRVVDPGAEAQDGPCGPDELPFDPQCPPGWNSERMREWLPEHVAAWYRALNPKAAQKEVREFVRLCWETPQADERAGFLWPKRGEDPDLAPREDCLFWTMSAEQIAAWLRAEIPDTPEKDAQEYAEKRIRRMEEVREKRAACSV
jgi:hypothetical protein